MTNLVIISRTASLGGAGLSLRSVAAPGTASSLAVSSVSGARASSVRLVVTSSFPLGSIVAVAFINVYHSSHHSIAKLLSKVEIIRQQMVELKREIVSTTGRQRNEPNFLESCASILLVT